MAAPAARRTAARNAPALAPTAGRWTRPARPAVDAVCGRASAAAGRRRKRSTDKAQCRPHGAGRRRKRPPDKAQCGASRRR